MIIKVKAFARFTEAFGKEHSLEPDGKATAMAPPVGLCAPHNAHDPIFDESGMIRKYANTQTGGISGPNLRMADEVAIFPPVAGG